MHRGDALQRKVVVHHREHTLLHLAAVPGVEDDLLTGGDIESDAGFAAEAELLVVLDLGLGGAVDDEIGFLVEFLLVLRTDEHIGDEVGLPGDFHNEADLHPGVGVGAAETVHYEEALAAELLLGEFLDDLPGLFRHLVVVVVVAFGVPPDFAGGAFLGGLVVDDVFVLGRTAGVDAGHHVDGAEFRDLAFVVAFEAGLGLLIVEDLVSGIVKNLLDAGNTVIG